jgi:hypothetical protein
MDYRYPPPFLFIFMPIGMLSYTVAAYVWFGLKLIALGLTLRALYRMVGGDIGSRPVFWLLPFFVAVPYLVEELQYGNVHFFIVCLTVLALYFFETGRAKLSAFALALSISIKVFPGFFLPYFLIRRKYWYVALTLLFVAVINLMPAFYFGFQENVELLRTWYDHVIRNRDFHEFQGGINHSLKGVLQRYLSRIPYEDRFDKRFSNINVANLDERSLQIMWYVVTGLVLLLMAYLGFRQSDDRKDRLLTYGLIACAILAFAPITGYNYFVMLILPSAVLSSYLLRHYEGEQARVILVLTITAALLSFLPPLVPGKVMQRFVQVHSPYFFSTLAMFAASAVALISGRR